MKGTKYEGEIKLAEAKIALHKKDLKTALKILDSVKSDQDIFAKVSFSLIYIYEQSICTLYLMLFNNFNCRPRN